LEAAPLDHFCSWTRNSGIDRFTEWAEENAAELKEKAVAYLNNDVAGLPELWRFLGAFDVGSDSFCSAVREDPKTGRVSTKLAGSRAL